MTEWLVKISIDPLMIGPLAISGIEASLNRLDSRTSGHWSSDPICGLSCHYSLTYSPPIAQEFVPSFDQAPTHLNHNDGDTLDKPPLAPFELWLVSGASFISPLATPACVRRSLRCSAALYMSIEIASISLLERYYFSALLDIL